MSARKPKANHERDKVTIRLPRWLVTWLESTATLTGETKTDLVEQGLIKGHRLKQPK